MHTTLASVIDDQIYRINTEWKTGSIVKRPLWLLLINFKSSINKYSQGRQSVEWNFLSIPKLQTYEGLRIL